MITHLTPLNQKIHNLSQPKNTNALRPSVEKFRQRLIDMRVPFDTEVPSVKEVLQRILTCCTPAKAETKKNLTKYATDFTEKLVGTDTLLRRQVLSHFHQLIRLINVFLKSQSARVKKREEEEASKDMYPYLPEKKKPSNSSSCSSCSKLESSPIFESDMLAACQYKLERLKYPYASLDLNDPFILAQSIGFCERYYIKALKSKRRELVAKYTSDGAWNRNFTKYLVCLKCPEHVIDSKLALRVHWLFRHAEHCARRKRRKN